MAGYLYTTGSWTVKDYGPSGIYNGPVLGTLAVQVASNGYCTWDVAVNRDYDANNDGHPDGNYFRIYIEINGVICLNYYNQDGSYKQYKTSGSFGGISSAKVSIDFGLACSQNSTAEGTMTYKRTTLTRTAWNEVGGDTATTVSIIDNGNNTFTLKATKGSNGLNNPATLGNLRWGYNYNYNDSYTSGATKTLSLNGTEVYRTVYAKATTYGTYGAAQTVTAAKAIKQYIAPTTPGKPTIHYNKNRLTLKENWNFTWAAATDRGYSGVTGYRLWLYRYRNGAETQIPLSTNSTHFDSSLSTLKHGTYSNCSFTFNPVDYGFAVGDSVKLRVYAYTFYANSTIPNLFSSLADSATSVIQNAGIVYVKSSNVWKEGQVYVKNNGVWKEAESVQVKNNGVWKESN